MIKEFLTKYFVSKYFLHYLCISTGQELLFRGAKADLKKHAAQ